MVMATEMVVTLRWREVIVCRDRLELRLLWMIPFLLDGLGIWYRLSA